MNRRSTVTLLLFALVLASCFLSGQARVMVLYAALIVVFADRIDWV